MIKNKKYGGDNSGLWNKTSRLGRVCMLYQT